MATGWLLAIFAFTTATAVLLLLLKDPPADPLARRLAQVRLVAQPEPGSSPEHGELPASESAGVDAPAARGMTGAVRSVLAALDARMERRGIARRLLEMLRRAGLRLLPAEFLAFQVVLALLGLLVGTEGLSEWLLALAGFLAPVLWLRRRMAARIKAFEDELPDTLELLANSLRSGYSLMQAMEVVSREMPEPMAREIGQVLREARVGVPMEDALTALTRRVPSTDLDLAVTAVLIQRQVGGNLAEVLDRIGETIRDRVRLLGQIRTMTAQGRLSGYIVAALPVLLGLALFALNKEYIRPLFHTPLGIAMLAVGCVMQGTGLTVIRRMVRPEV